MGFIVISYCLFIGFFVTFLMMSFSSYKRRFNRTFSIKNTFAYEINIQNGFKENLIGNISLILSNICLVLFFTNYNLSSKNGYLIALVISGILLMISISVCVLASDKIKAGQTYIIPLIYLFSFVYSAIFALGTYSFYSDTKKVVYLVLMIISCVMVLINIAIMLSPNMSMKIPYSEKTENGRTVYIRPKKIFLAYSQWISLFCFIGMTALSLILMIIQK